MYFKGRLLSICLWSNLSVELAQFRANGLISCNDHLHEELLSNQFNLVLLNMLCFKSYLWDLSTLLKVANEIWKYICKKKVNLVTTIESQFVLDPPFVFLNSKAKSSYQLSKCYNIYRHWNSVVSGQENVMTWIMKFLKRFNFNKMFLVLPFCLNSTTYFVTDYYKSFSQKTCTFLHNFTNVPAITNQRISCFCINWTFSICFFNKKKLKYLSFNLSSMQQIISKNYFYLKRFKSFIRTAKQIKHCIMSIHCK